MKPPVRWRLLIGPPASGKTALALRLPRLLAPTGAPRPWSCRPRWSRSGGG